MDARLGMPLFETLSLPELRQSITAIIRRHLPEVTGAIGDDADLRELGLDSLRFVWVLADLDRDLGIEIPDALFDLDHFRTLGTTLATVMRLRDSAGE